jgi:hypothetical protein
MKRCVWLGVLMMAGISCTNPSVVSPDMGLYFFPLQVGQFHIYQMNETNILNSNETKSSYELKVVTTDSVINENGVIVYTLHRYKRNSDADDWAPLSTWAAKIELNRALQNEDNIWFVKLVFPPSPGLTWNGNAFNDLPDNGNLFNDRNSDRYRIENFNEPAKLSTGYEAMQTLTVIQNSYNDPVTGRDERKEIYARQAGLIYKEVIQWKYCTGGSCLGQQKIEIGITLIQTLKEYGKI